MKRKLLYACTSALLMAGMVQFSSCKKEESSSTPTPAAPTYADYSIDPKNPDSLSKVITFGNAKFQKGDWPSTASTNTVSIDYDPSLSVSTGGSTTYLPIVYKGTETFSKVLLIIKGATAGYFIYDASVTDLTGIFFVPMTIPKSVMQGNFELKVLLMNGKGDIVSNKVIAVPVQIKKPYECSASGASVNGSSGITQTLHALDGKAGNVIMKWNTNTIPDRIDVYLDGKWVNGTGASAAPPPPLCPCSNPLPGFVGSSGTFTIPVTASNKNIEVYVSGCTGSGTAWDYNLKCAQ